MASTDDKPDTPVENNAETGGVTGKGFQPGQSGNPGGRPKGIARRVRELVGDDGDTLVAFLGAVVSGYVVAQKPGERQPTHEKVAVGDRIKAAQILMERGWGKAPQFAPIEDTDPLELGVTGADLAADFEEALDELDARRRKKAAEQAAQQDAAAADTGT